MKQTKKVLKIKKKKPSNFKFQGPVLKTVIQWTLIQAVVHYDDITPSYPRVKTPGVYVFKNLVFL